MLTTDKYGKNTKSICYIEGGIHDGKTIHLNPDLINLNPGLFEDYLEFEYKQGNDPDLPQSNTEYYMMKKAKGKKITKVLRQKLLKEISDEKESVIGKELILSPIDDSKIFILPDLLSNDVISIFGRKGVGKSTLAAKFAERYRELFPDNQIVLFSRIENDKSINCEKLDITRVPVDLTLLDFKVNLDDLRPSLTIIDDVDGLQTLLADKGKKGEKLGERLYNKVTHLENDLVRLGRDHDNKGDIHSIHIRHMLYEPAGKTKVMLNGSTCVIIFPGGIDSCHYDRFCKEKAIGRDMKEKMRNVRWFGYCCSPCLPTYLVGEKFIYIL